MRADRVRGWFAVLTAVAISMTSAGVASASATNPTVPDSEVSGDVGDVGLVNMRGETSSSGDGTTQFFVRLPKGASCPGDSANDQWRLHSFLLPEADDPLDIVFDSTGPVPAWSNNRWPLFADDTATPMSSVMLPRNDGPGEAAPVGATPVSSFRVQAENQFPGGRYRLGMACTYFDQTTQYWDTLIDMTAVAADGDPTTLTWTLPDPVTIGSSSTQSTNALRIVLVVVGAAGLASAFLRRRADRAAPTSNQKEASR